MLLCGLRPSLRASSACEVAEHQGSLLLRVFVGCIKPDFINFLVIKHLGDRIVGFGRVFECLSISVSHLCLWRN